MIPIDTLTVGGCGGLGCHNNTQRCDPDGHLDSNGSDSAGVPGGHLDADGPTAAAYPGGHLDMDDSHEGGVTPIATSTRTPRRRWRTRRPPRHGRSDNSAYPGGNSTMRRQREADQRQDGGGRRRLRWAPEDP
ncbi:unnamed protein product [Urochloa humidicola]